MADLNPTTSIITLNAFQEFILELLFIISHCPI